MWVARDEDGGLFLYANKPVKGVHGWGADFNTPPDEPFWFMRIDGAMFPEVKWRDLNPTEAEVSITLKKKNKKPETGEQVMKEEEKNGYDPSKTFLTTKTASMLRKAGYDGVLTLQAAADWLRMNHGIHVSAEYAEGNLSWKNHVVKPGEFEETGSWYIDEYDAFESGIRKAVKLLG